VISGKRIRERLFVDDVEPGVGCIDAAARPA
jgi:hypothetical protein